MAEFQHVRLSQHHPRVHLASTLITEENKTEGRATYCGAGLGKDALLGVPQPVTCERCKAKLRARDSFRRR